MFSNSKAKANVSPDGGAPDTVGTAVAHTPVGNAQTPAGCSAARFAAFAAAVARFAAAPPAATSRCAAPTASSASGVAIWVSGEPSLLAPAQTGC